MTEQSKDATEFEESRRRGPSFKVYDASFEEWFREVAIIVGPKLGTNAPTTEDPPIDQCDPYGSFDGGEEPECFAARVILYLGE